MQFKRILSGFMSFTIALSAVSMPVFGAAYLNSSRTKWAGYDNNVRPADFDTWDGSSWDISWYNEAEGTKDDPYIIDSAADLVGLTHLTASTGNHTDNLLTNTVYSISNDVSLFSAKEHYAIPRNDTNRNFDAWYKYTMPTLNISFVRFDYTPVEYTIHYLDEYGLEQTDNTWYAKDIKIVLNVNGTEKSFDATDYVKSYTQLYADNSSGVYSNYYLSIITPYDTNAVYSIDDIGIKWSDGDYDKKLVAESDLNDWFVYFLDTTLTANVSDGLLIAHADYSDSSVDASDVKMTFGLLSDIGLPIFPTVVATNAAGKSIIIDENNYGDFYLPEKITPSSVTPTTIDLYDDLGFKSSSSGYICTGTGTSYNQPLSTNISRSLGESEIGILYRQAYFKQNTETESELIYMPNAVMSVLRQLSYKVSYNYNAETKVVTFDVVLCNKLRYSDNPEIGNHITYSLDLSTVIASYPSYTQLRKVDLYYKYNPSTDDFSLYGSATIGGPYYYSGEITTTGDTIIDNSVVDPFNIYSGLTILSSGEPINASECTLLGFSNVFSTTAKSIISRNCYVRDRQPMYAETSAEDPTFTNKYIRLDADIDIGVGDDSVSHDQLFPVQESNEFAGLNCDFDMNDRIIRTKTSLFGTICKNGYLHDGTIVATGIEQDNGPYLPFAVIDENFGVIDNLRFMPNSIFEYKHGMSQSMILVLNNLGQLRNCTGYVGQYDAVTLTNNNNNIIKNTTLMLITEPYTTRSGGPEFQFINSNKGIIDGFLFESDKDIAWDEGNIGHVSFSVVRVNDGYMSNITLNDFKINNSCSFSFVYVNSGTIDNLQSDFSIQNYGNISGPPMSMIGMGGTNSYNRNKGIIKNSRINYTGALKQYPLIYGAAGSSIINCDLDITITNENPNTNWYAFDFLRSDIYNSNIELNGMRNLLAISEYCNVQHVIGNIYNSYVHADYLATVNHNFNADAVEKAYNTKFDIDYLTLHSSTFAHAEDCVININEAIGVNDDARDDKGIFRSVKNTDLTIKSFTGVFSSFYAPTDDDSTSDTVCENSRFSITFKDEFISTGTDTIDVKDFINNCEFYYYFDDSAKGTMYGIGCGGYDKTKTAVYAMTNCLIYIDEMPDNVTLESASVISGVNNYPNSSRHDTKFDKGSGLTIIAPHLNINFNPRTSGAAGGTYEEKGFAIISGSRPDVSNIHDTYVYANLFFKDLSNLQFVSALNADAYISNSVISNNVWNINVYDIDGNVVDIPVYGIAGTQYPGSFTDLRINATILNSNSPSSKSAMLLYDQNEIRFLVDAKHNTILRDCVLNLPNTPDYIPGVTNSGEFPGFVRIMDYYTTADEDNTAFLALSGSLQRLGTIGIMNCYVPKNKSWACTSLNEDPSFDTFNILSTKYTENPTTRLENCVVKIVDKYGTDVPNDPTTQGIKFYESNGDTSGELAYLLDRGGTARRTYQWSVATADDYIKDSFTNEKIYEFPHSTIVSTLKIPDRCLGENSSLKPVFKTTMKAAEGGYVELEGIGDTHTNHDADDVVYVKQGQQIVSDIQSNDESVILVYATQQLGTAYPARIPNTPAETARAVDDAYTIKGYKQQSIDTIITPVFKTGYNITVDITGSEHGTIVPSAYISAEGEKITVSQDVENGYTITNLKVNGESLASDSFFMPAEEVTITGDCVPFEGGILSFKLFGFDGEIDQINKTIDVTVPRTSYITNALPEIEYVGDYISPSENSRVDFTNPVEYTVTYGEGQTVTYTVTVKVGEYTMRIYDFIVDGVHGEINQARRTINVKMPSGTDLQHITPESIIYSAESILANEHEERNFLTPQVYTLYATGMTPVSYVVTMTTADDDEAEITQFKVSGYEGVIDQDNSVITLNVPNGIDFTDIMPDIIKYTGKKLEINKASKNDLSSTTYYTVTSQNDIDRQYEVVANYISDNEAHIDTFTLAGIEGEIDQATKTITLTVPKGTILTDVKPDELTYTAKSIYPRIDTLQDFTAPVEYTVIAPDNTEVTYTVKVESKKSSEALLYEFDILGFKGEVNQEDKTVTVKFPFGIDISNTPPSNVIISEGATISPTEDDIQDFRNPIEYIVTAEDGVTTNKYTVNCIVDVPDKEAIITHFEILDTPGEIDQNEKEITITLPSDTTPDDLKDVVPEITWSGETLNPDEDTPQDFNNPPDYTVTAKDPTVVVTYDIIVKVLPKEPTPQSKPEPQPPKELDKTAIITHFEILDTPGDIDEDEKTITIELPSDTKPEDLEDIKPTIKWKGEDITPDDDKPQNFNNPPDYTVTAEDPTIKNTYEIIVKIKEPEVIITPGEPDKTAIITHFELLDTPGIIDQENHVITIRLPWDINPEDLVDAIPMIVWEGKTINPDENEPNDFNKTLTYTVTAEDPEVKVTYTVYTTIVDKPYDVNPGTGVANSSTLIGFTAFCAVLAVATSRKNKLLNND